MTEPSDLPVLIVGAGPTGLTAANLLGSMGVRALLVERNATTSDDAKAISLDDESLRICQVAGLDEPDPTASSSRASGTRYFDACGRPLVHARVAAALPARPPVQEPIRPARPRARAARDT